MNQAIIFSLMMKLVPLHHQQPEVFEEAAARYQTIAATMASEAKTSQEVAFLMTIARHESNYRKEVHTGKVRGDVGKSYGLYQILVGRGTTRFAGYFGKDIVGTDYLSTKRATKAAVNYVRWAAKRCRNRPRCVFMTYGGVRNKNDKRIVSRVNTYQRLRAMQRVYEGKRLRKHAAGKQR